MKLSDLTSELQEKRLTGDAEVFGLCTDSRVAEKGDLFFCFRGGNTDSHDCAEEAASRGAAAIVCERELSLPCPQVIVKDGREAMARLAAAFYHHPERSLKIVGVTGTNGKTTVSHMLDSILNEAGM
ncbi:MAG: UDP-N-acetylmuramoyl-L-alanyl-D-glutamate--2,6-diaminopimelate ligase, partial [Clostridiales bacterium]|nr:UDP-N-acetylmuramoyl-L-alanyl-D-glutamate--2,6-diaminopimelate ligase [Clostridiales bacterium]